MMNFYFQTQSLPNAKDIQNIIYKPEEEGKIEFAENSSKVKIFMDRSVTCFFSSSMDILSLVKELQDAGNFYIVYWGNEMYGEIHNKTKDSFQKEFEGLVGRLK
jgi:hypothetical protein